MNFYPAATIRRFCLVVGLAVVSLLPAKCQADVIIIDLSAVDPRFHEVFQRAEAVWESRIQNFSTDLPEAFLLNLPKLRLVCRTPFLDGPGGLLGGATTKFILQYQTFSNTTFNQVNRTMPVAALLQIDSGDFPTTTAEEEMFLDTIVHEMGHALGIGSLWTRNDLIGPLEGVGLVQYTGGKYALRTYRKEANLPLATFIPLNQNGGPGTALGHWDETSPSFFNQTFTPAFKKELMTGFACDRAPNGSLVCAPKFISETTWASLADVGWEVAGINDNAVDPPAPGTLESRWPKIVGNIASPFNGTQIDIAPGVVLRATNIEVVYMSGIKSNAAPTDKNLKTPISIDPYGLRKQRWVK